MQENDAKKVVTRFAPSPTGHFHLGGVRSALYNYLFARQNSGIYILRSEDTDRARSKKEYEDGFIELFKWLGLEYDFFYRQSERGEIYKRYIQKLIDDGYAYVSKEEVVEGDDKRSEVIRFKNPNKTVIFNDLILGEISTDTSDLKDFVIARSFDEPLYHLTVVIDDHEMAVTHVIRGQEHVANTARQILIIEAIGANRPIYAHLPLILGKDKSKLSKRDPEVIPALEYRNLGYLPEAILNFMALIGWNPGGEREIFSKDELIKIFDLSKVQKSGGVFNSEKLDWINKEHMKLLSIEERNSEIFKVLDSNNVLSQSVKMKDGVFLNKLYQVIFERINKWSDVNNLIEEGEVLYFFTNPTYDSNLLLKDVSKEEVVEHLGWIMGEIKKSDDSIFDNVENIKKLIFDYATEKGRGKVLWPLRVCLSGKDKSPDPFTLMYILGKQECLNRIQLAISKL